MNILVSKKMSLALGKHWFSESWQASPISLQTPPWSLVLGPYLGSLPGLVVLGAWLLIRGSSSENQSWVGGHLQKSCPREGVHVLVKPFG